MLGVFALLVVCGTAFGGISKVHAADLVGSGYYVDADQDGTVDHAEYIFDENIDQCIYEAGDWTIDTAGTIGIIAITGIDTSGVESPGTGTCDGTDGRVYLNVTATANITGGAVAPVISYTNQGTDGSLSGVTTAVISNQSHSMTDWVAPAVISTGPADASTGQSRSGDITMTFTEPMTTTFQEGTEFTVSPDPGGFTAVWSAGDTVLTLVSPNFSCYVTYTVTTDALEIGASTGAVTNYLNTAGPVTGDWSFTTGGGCSHTVAETVSVKTTVTLTSPAEGAVLVPGSVEEITWETVSGYGYATLWYSHDNGENYTEIARNVADNGRYLWTVPAQTTEYGRITIESTDLATVVASATSPVFSITDDTSTATSNPEDVSPEDAGEVANGVQPNTYIVGTSFTAVYYVDSAFLRHPFLNEQIYFTWQSDFSAVQQVSDATLAALTIGVPILPKPETMLVKIQSDPSVYAVEVNSENEFSPILKRLDSEATAEILYGSAWATRVIDIPPTLFGRYTMSTEIISAS